MTGVNKKRLHFILVILAAAIALMCVFHLLYVSAYNENLHTVKGNAKTEDTYMDLHFRGDSTSTWIKQDTGIYGSTYDGTLYNNSSNPIDSWMLYIYIHDDCYINQFWTGTVEIHQHVGSSDEVVQTLNLANYTEDELKLDYVMDASDLLIPLSEGDYIVYIPSEKNNETIIEGGENVVVGSIFYYKYGVDLSDYELKFYYHKEFTEGAGFVLINLLLLVWLFIFALYIITIRIYKKAELEMELQKSGIACMTELYSLMYIIDLSKDTLTPVGVLEEYDKARPKDLTATEQMKKLFETDPMDEYLEAMQTFGDLTTLKKRMKETNTLVIEYISKYYGWNRVRFIAMDRKVGDPLEKVLFTVEQIEGEKKDREELLDQVEKAESESKAKSTFLANMSHEIRTPINTVLGLDTMILRESSEDNIKTYARDIKNAGNMLLSLINGILDFSKLEAGKMELIPAEYSLRQMLYDVQSITRSKFETKGLEFEIDVTPSVPDRLYGDDVRLKQVIINLLTNASKYTDSGRVRLGVYGKAVDEKKIHFLFTVKDTGSGIKTNDLKKLSQRFARFDEEKNRNVEGTGIGMNLVNSLLALMNSELKVASIYGRGSDFYFEIDQEIVDPEPIGEVDWEEAFTVESEEYEASFTAEDAHILVVDDNGMNLNVFENLLKETKIQIDKALSGQEALKLTMKNKYHLIFMDHMMPEMDGIETMQKIKAQENGKNKDTTIIVLTANAVQGAREEYLEEGFHDFLSKPIDADMLEEKIIKNVPSELIKKCGSKKKKNKNSASLPEIDGIDSAYALEHVGSVDGVLQVMQQFVAVAPSDKEELEGYYEQLKANKEDEDALTSYRIKVHAMKTSASLCGSLMVYGVAAQLEFAARDEKVDEVLDLSPYFFDFWMDLHKKIKAYFDKKASKVKKPEINREKLESLLHQLDTVMQAFDISGADEIVAELDSFDLGENLKDKMDELKAAVVKIDADACTKLCEEMLNVK
ncbi:MAG: response regulator [Lachnospiraceae bacterium]|nr:response regulator [Lachnospiraceae bacterium]